MFLMFEEPPCCLHRAHHFTFPPAVHQDSNRTRAPERGPQGRTDIPSSQRPVLALNRGPLSGRSAELFSRNPRPLIGKSDGVPSLLFPAGEEAQHGGGLPDPGAGRSARGRAVEHGRRHLQLRRRPGQEQEEPHPQSGRLQRGEPPSHGQPSLLAHPRPAQGVFLSGSSVPGGVTSCDASAQWGCRARGPPHIALHHMSALDSGVRGPLGESKTPLAQRLFILFNIT